MKNLEALLTERLSTAFEKVAGFHADPVLRRSQRADFQADGALSLARALKQNPREIAAQVVGVAELDDLCASAEVAGPGFINLTLSNIALGRLTAEASHSQRLGVEHASAPQTVTIDYSAPNIAKEMHVGHLRSTIIGDAAVRLLSWLGHTVVRQNHVGDWGTPFGMLIEHMSDLGERDAAHELSMGDLNAFYRAAREKYDSDEGFAQRSRQRVVALQGGDEETLARWRFLVEQSQNYFMRVYDEMDVMLEREDFAGESSYNDQLGSVVDELRSLGLLQESDGALCVFPEGFSNRDGDPLPLIVQKSDGGYGYASTDLATIRYRLRDLGAQRLLYIVGTPQSQHFAMIFETAREARWLVPPATAEHINFGSVLGKDGKLLRTRAGESVKLADLLEEAVTRARAAVEEKNPELDDETKHRVARQVGIGAVKYADLSTQRIKDYVFDFDRMLSFDGNTGPYLQYAHARIRSILRRADQAPPRNRVQLRLTTPEEHELSVELLRFGAVIDTVATSLEFHTLAGYLYDLAAVFTKFYEKCPVLASEGDVHITRLVLCDITARTLATGLNTLGIEAPDRM